MNRFLRGFRMRQASWINRSGKTAIYRALQGMRKMFGKVSDSAVFKLFDRNPAELRKAQLDFLKCGEFSQTIYDMAFSCIACHFCSDVCEQGLDPSRMGSISRIELVSRVRTHRRLIHSRSQASISTTSASCLLCCSTHRKPDG